MSWILLFCSGSSFSVQNHPVLILAGFSGDIRHKEMFFKFSSQITPGTIYHVDMGQSKPEVDRRN